MLQHLAQILNFLWYHLSWLRPFFLLYSRSVSVFCWPTYFGFYLLFCTLGTRYSLGLSSGLSWLPSSLPLVSLSVFTLPSLLGSHFYFPSIRRDKLLFFSPVLGMIINIHMFFSVILWLPGVSVFREAGLNQLCRPSSRIWILFLFCSTVEIYCIRLYLFECCWWFLKIFYSSV